MHPGPVSFVCAILAAAPVTAAPLAVIGDGAEVTAAISRAGREVVGPAGVRELLERRAAATAPDPTAARELAARGRTAYSSAEFTAAIDLLSRAAEEVGATGLREVPLAEVAAVHLDLGIAYLADHRTSEAEREMTLALRLKPDIAVDPDHGPPARRALATLRAGLGRLRTFQRALITDPAGASVEVDGTPRGQAPLTLDLAAGSHLVLCRARGRDPVVQRIEVDGPSQIPLTLSLPEASPARAALDALDAGAVDEAASPILTALDLEAVVAVRREGAALRGTLVIPSGPARTAGAATAADLVAALLPASPERLLPALQDGRQEDLVPRAPATPRRAARGGGSGSWWIWAGGATLAAGVAAVAYVLLSSGGAEASGQMDLVPVVDR